MKIKRHFLVTFLVLFSLSAYTQDCKMYFPENVNSVREMTNYDKKDRMTGRVVQEILDKDVSGGDVTLTVATVIYGEDDEELHNSEVKVGCSDGVFKIDMRDYVGELIKQYESMEVELKGDNLLIPSDLSSGDELPDGNVNIKVSNSGITMVNMDVTIKNRKVEGQEEITTEAGTFDCYKISYDSEAKTNLFTVTTGGVEWLSPGVGVVKSESYNKKGKLTAYSLLTKLEK